MLNKAMNVLSLFTATRTEISVMTATELLDRPVSTVSRWLSGMESAGFLDRDPDTSRYRLSMRLAAIGELAKRATPLHRSALPFLRQLTQITGETSNLVLLVEREGANVEAVESPQPIAHLGAVGRRFPLHASSAGKALLAWRPREEVLALTGSALASHTATTITNLEDLMHELARVRSEGYAVSWQEHEEGLIGIGAPVWDHRGEVVAALSISAPVFRVARPDLPKLGAHVAEAATGLSRSLGYVPAEGGFADTREDVAPSSRRKGFV